MLYTVLVQSVPRFSLITSACVFDICNLTFHCGVLLYSIFAQGPLRSPLFPIIEHLYWSLGLFLGIDLALRNGLPLLFLTCNPISLYHFR